MSGAFGSFFDTYINSFGIDFVAGENNVFGINPFPPPTSSLIANYDFNFYTANEPTIANQVVGSPIGTAIITEEFANVFDETDPANKFLTIHAPNNFPLLTGSINTPIVSSVYSTEMWVRLDVEEAYGQYFVDFRTGQDNGFIIGSSGSGNVGAGWVGQKIYYNTIGQTLTSTTNVVSALYNAGWTQVVLVSSVPFEDDLTFFARFSLQQGMPISVADIYIYNTILTNADVITLYNAKCSRYGLPPV